MKKLSYLECNILANEIFYVQFFFLLKLYKRLL